MTDDHKDLILGLDGSLKMMEQVLNDVLSFNRMESGNLTLARRPFSFHRAVQYVGLAHRATAEVVGLDFELVLDPRIDTMGGVVLGDEMRFKQICSNLISNAFKFTTSGGVKLVTKLLYPRLPDLGHSVGVLSHHGDPEGNATSHEEKPPLSPLEKHDSDSSTDKDKPRGRSGRSASTSRTFATATDSTAVSPQRKVSKAVIRVEVHDTGVGLSLSDVRDNRLFSPYVQTELGRRQGGKGSGLGLALVTQIVKLSGGRLGVDSEPGKGSVFW
jgi:signal transduction histidine kinase